MSTKPKILVIDIETAPAIGYIWKLFDENISLDQLLEPSRIICAAFKWYGEGPITFYSEWEDGNLAMLTGIHDAIDEANAVITFNGDKFDLVRLNGEFIAYGLSPVAPVTSIDLRKTIKKLGLQSGKLDYAVQYYHIGKKIETEGFKLWRKLGEDCPKARERMERYNKHDVKLTSALYTLLRPYMTTHPHLTGGGTCPNCGSKHLHSRGYKYTRTTKTQRLCCVHCGAWSQGVRTRIK